MKILAIGGMPGVGKTSLALKLIRGLSDRVKFTKVVYKLDHFPKRSGKIMKINLPTLECSIGGKKIIIVGIYQKGYRSKSGSPNLGTDPLNMVAPVVFPGFIEELSNVAETPCSVFFEGQGLFKKNCLAKIEAIPGLEKRFVFLETSPENYKERCTIRAAEGKLQTKRFRQSINTSLTNIRNSLTVESWPNNNFQDMADNVKNSEEWLVSP